VTNVGRSIKIWLLVLIGLLAFAVTSPAAASITSVQPGSAVIALTATGHAYAYDQAEHNLVPHAVSVGLVVRTPPGKQPGAASIADFGVAAEGEGTVSVYHGSLNASTQIQAEGLAP
jgi:hypothetical protein